MHGFFFVLETFVFEAATKGSLTSMFLTQQKQTLCRRVYNKCLLNNKETNKFRCRRFFRALRFANEMSQQ